MACDIVPSNPFNGSGNLAARGLIAEAREMIENLEYDNPIHTKALNEFRPRLEVLEEALVTYQADGDIDKLLDAVDFFKEHYRSFKYVIERSRGRTPEDLAKIAELRKRLQIGLEYFDAYTYIEKYSVMELYQPFPKDPTSGLIILNMDLHEAFITEKTEDSHARADADLQLQVDKLEEIAGWIDELSALYPGEHFSIDRNEYMVAKTHLLENVRIFQKRYEHLGSQLGFHENLLDYREWPSSANHYSNQWQGFYYYWERMFYRTAPPDTFVRWLEEKGIRM